MHILERLFQPQKTIKNLEQQLKAEKLRSQLYKMNIEQSRKKDPITLVAGFDSTEVEPQDAKERLEYCEQVFIFYENILKEKLRAQIAKIRQDLALIQGQEAYGLSRDQYDFLLRGMEAQCWALDEWCQLRAAERRSVLSEENKESE